MQQQCLRAVNIMGQLAATTPLQLWRPKPNTAVNTQGCHHLLLLVIPDAANLVLLAVKYATQQTAHRQNAYLRHSQEVAAVVTSRAGLQPATQQHAAGGLYASISSAAVVLPDSQQSTLTLWCCSDVWQAAGSVVYGTTPAPPAAAAACCGTCHSLMVLSLPADTNLLSSSHAMSNTQSAWPIRVCTGRNTVLQPQAQGTQHTSVEQQQSMAGS